jgi:hypothetical protein
MGNMIDEDFTTWQSNFGLLHTRMDETWLLRKMADYGVLCDEHGDPMKNTSQIILNYPRVFGDAMVAMLNKDEETPVVSRCDKTIQSNIEEWWGDVKENNNRRLSEGDRETLDEADSFDICYRGWLAHLPLVSYDPITKLYLLTIEPYDTRWMIWKRGPRGIEKTLNWVKLDREKTQRKYHDYTKKNGLTPVSALKGKDNDVSMAIRWDTERYSLFEADHGIIPANADPWMFVDHGLGFCPMKVVPCPIAPERTNKNGFAEDLKERGPDIYAPIIKTTKYMNEFISILATVNRQQMETPLQVEGGLGLDLTGVTFHGWGTVIPTPTGVKIIPIAQPQVSGMGQNLFVEMFKSFEVATLSTVNYGMAGDRQSAIAVITLKGDNEKQLGPRRAAKNTMRIKDLNSMAYQIRTGKFYKTDIAKDNEFAVDKVDPSLFKEKDGKKLKFFVKFQYDYISSQENVANMQLFLEGKQGGIEEEWLADNLLHVKDPPTFVKKNLLSHLSAMIPAIPIAKAITVLDPTNKPLEGEVDLMVRDILFGTLKEIRDNQQHPLRQPQNQAQGSPANLMNNPAQANPNKLASNEQKMNGQAAQRDAMRSREG